MFLHNSSNISYFSPQISPSTPINQINQFSQFKQPMVSLHNHTTIPSSSLILPTPGTTPTLPTPIASPILPPSSSYIDDNYFNEFINIDNNTTITSNNNNEENLPCVCDSPSTVHSSSENGDLEEIDPDLFTFLIYKRLIALYVLVDENDRENDIQPIPLRYINDKELLSPIVDIDPRSTVKIAIIKPSLSKIKDYDIDEKTNHLKDTLEIIALTKLLELFSVNDIFEKNSNQYYSPSLK
ncbi:4243_t:CDS:2 [Entrophospora sp. SA101]|nr:4243_t:CDS:2 [Entrophospora sp. SA101]